jgi:hypothetical protein
MRTKPGGRTLRFTATQELDVARVGFSWRARFPIAGPLSLTVVDGLAGGVGELRVSLLGVPLQRQRGPELDVGEAMRYLAELPWAPHAIAANRELEWRPCDERTVEVRHAAAALRWHFDDRGDVTSVTGTRPYPVGKAYRPTGWAGAFADFTTFEGTRVPAAGEAWWDLAEGRFVYWRGRVESLELVAG